MAKNKKKQETLDLDLDFTNIAKAQVFFTEEKSAKKEPIIVENKDELESKKSWFLLNLKKNYKKKFLMIFTDYREYNECYDVNASEFFNLSCDFLIKKHIEMGVYEKAPISFTTSAFRKGKREIHERTPSLENKTSLRLVGYKDALNNYGDLCYYFTKTFHNEDFVNPCYSKSFFFYDFINEMEKYKKEIIDYDIL
ncbi:hypothetical protein J2Q00_13950 [Tenacibaculum finnmarkense genomovar finnmarkense]|uniref:hypothetical protein n=4 Tax=Tenacibaculum finnmarkense TaxID=2781243 RepID=UPI001EFA718F|nr:hypothetical protein [Tenacibaculum finnmarkense]MCG8186960.1 hypothetical protein [Tenacibaculum finnmarkense genomovar finnmarkense]MCG8203690.1 hypothetical protein [Tenacibaculum finnmarkense genomovar finnmarkense]MCG8213918.1 hypothetical protein [Tenacibaculum finnmarkense genomovar finnmarkense]MCG8229481.1 hypothetical protein [Tenacibaculum finnmarkense genomovar finnmarkense]MCG8250596.1 hypothetical protein [Tenacibaculum finnmarkense genomovar finnmarkense]